MTTAIHKFITNIISKATKSHNHKAIIHSKPQISRTIVPPTYKEMSYNDVFQAIRKEIVDATTHKSQKAS